MSAAQTLQPPPLAFSEDDVQRAAEEWNCNCGPGALAALLGMTLGQVRTVITGFEERGYMSPTMMRAAVEAAGLRIICDDRRECRSPSLFPPERLIRIQWEGPWTKPEGNPRWAYGATHWIATRVKDGRLWIFDINAGWTTPAYWQDRVVPMITDTIRRATGGWFATHTWAVGPQQRGDEGAQRC